MSRADYQSALHATLRERVLKALGAAERAERELVEANREIRELCEALGGVMHPSMGKLVTSHRDAASAVALLRELKARIPR